MKVLIFVILSVVFGNCFAKSKNNVVNSNVNLNVNVSVINDSIKKIREDFEIYKKLFKSEYDGKIEVVNQENDGRFQVFQILFGIVITVLLFVIGYSRYDVSSFIKNDANDKIKFEVTNIFDEKFEKRKNRIKEIEDEANTILIQIKEIQTSVFLEMDKINSKHIIEKIELKNKYKKQ